MTRLNYLLGSLFILGSLTSSAQLNVQIKLGDRNACTNSTLLFLDSIVSGTPTSYEWISSVATFSSTSASITKASFSASGQVILKSLDATSTFYDTVYVTLNSPPVVTLGNDLEVCCDYGPIVLDSIVVAPTGAPHTTGYWSTSPNPSLIVNGSTFNTAEACGLIAAPASSIQTSLVYAYQDPTTQCVNRDSMKVRVRGLPRTVLLDKQYCQDIDSIRLDNDVVVSPANTSIGIPSWRCLDSNSSANYFFADMLDNRGSQFAPDWWLNVDESNYEIQNTDKDTIVLEFTYENEYGCTSKDTVDIEIWRVPKITFSTNRELCWDEGKMSLNTLTGVNLTDGFWTVYDSTGFRQPGTLGGLNGDTINTLNSIPLSSASAIPNRYLIRYDHIATGCPAQNETTLTINPLPVVNLTQLTPDRFCETASNISLNANPAGGTWSSNDPSALVGGSTFSPGNASTIFPDSIHFRYNYTSNVTGCKNVESIYALVDASPKISYPTGTESCRTKGTMTETLQFALTGQNTDQIDWYNFNPGAPRVTLGTVASQNITLNYQADSTEVFRIIFIAQGRGSCEDVGGFFNITVHPIPQATLTNDNPEGCNPVTTTLAVNMTNQVDPATSSYAWTLGDPENTTATTASTSVTYTQKGQPSANLTITSAQGCDTTLSVTTQVNPKPKARFTINPNNNTPVTLPRFSFTSTSTVSIANGAMITDYAWDFGDSAGTTSTVQSVTFFYPADTATYQVNLTVTTNQGCSDVYGYPVHVGKPGAVSVQDLASDEVMIYPNPSTGQFTVSDNVDHISIYDVNGREVKDYQTIRFNSFFIPTRGMYFVQLRDRNSQLTAVKKVVVR